MNIHTAKRIAAAINLIAASVLLGIGYRSGNTAFMVLGAVFLLLGILRLWQTRSAPPGG